MQVTPTVRRERERVEHLKRAKTDEKLDQAAMVPHQWC